MELYFDNDSHLRAAVSHYENVARWCHDELHRIKQGRSPFAECEAKTEFKYFTVLMNRSVTARTRATAVVQEPQKTPRFWEAYRALIVAAERVYDFIGQMSFICDSDSRVPKPMRWETKAGYAELMGRLHQFDADFQERKAATEAQEAEKKRQDRRDRQAHKDRQDRKARKDAEDSERKDAEAAAVAFEAERVRRAHEDSAKVVLKSIAHGTYVHADGDNVAHRKEPSFWRMINHPDGTVLLQPWDTQVYLSKVGRRVCVESRNCRWTVEHKYIKVADRDLYLSTTDTGSVDLQPHKRVPEEISMLLV